MLATVNNLLKNLGKVRVGQGRSYKPGSFNSSLQTLGTLMQGMNSYTQDNAKLAGQEWESLFGEYVKDVQELQKQEQEEANQHRGFWELAFGALAVAAGTIAIVATAGLATPLVVGGWAVGLSAGAYGLSNMFEGGTVLVTSADKAWNPLRDTLFQGNQGAYDIFGNVAVFAAGTMIPIGAAVNAGRTFSSAVISGGGRSILTVGAGMTTNFVVAPFATSLVKQAGVNDTWANSIGTATGFGTSIFAGREGYKYRAKQITLKNGEVAYESSYGEIVRSKKYLNIDGQIKWPKADGFVTGKKGQALSFDSQLKEGQIIDRYGSPSGRFSSPVKNGTPASYDSRGLPYPEITQEYHQYRVLKDITIENVEKSYSNLPVGEKSNLDKAMKFYGFTLEDIAKVQEGKISKVFDSGGGTQFKSTISTE